MEDISRKINLFSAEVKVASGYLSTITGIELTDGDIIRALLDHYDMQDSTLLLEKNLDNLKIIVILKEYDFNRLKPELLGTIELEEGIIPTGWPQLLTEETIKNKNEIWQIHKHDADPFPHPVHAHNYAANVKLDLRDGKLYRKHNEVGSIGEKELDSIRGKVKNITLPDKTI